MLSHSLRLTLAAALLAAVTTTGCSSMTKGTVTGAGRLYEVDMRLRPDGAKGLLVSSLESFADYQRHRAWTWEQQALVRARAVAGDPALCRAFADIREHTLRRPREPAVLLSDVRAMRWRMRGELDRSTALRFDLKQGEGGLVDLEFLLQAQVLARAAEHPGVCAESATPALIGALAASGAFTAEQAAALVQAHETLLTRGLECTLDRRPRWAPEDAAVAQARAIVRAICAASGLDFAAAPAA